MSSVVASHLRRTVIFSLVYLCLGMAGYCQDTILSEKYLIEIGGKNKTKKQISGVDNAFVAVDNIEFGYGNQIPLWLFGFTY